MHRRRFLLALLSAGALAAILLVATASAATTYYFSSSTGSDSNACTQSAPCKTLAKIQSLNLQPGDSVALMRGDLWSGGLVVGQSGSSAGRISFYGYGSASTRPRIVGGTAQGDCIRVNGSFVTIDNLETDACDQNDTTNWGVGVDVFGSDTTVQNSYSSNNTVGLRQATNTANVVFTGNTLVNNNVLNQNTSSGSSGADGVQLNGPAVVTGNTISGSDASSLAYGRDGAAVEMFNAGNAWIKDNSMTNNNTGVEAGGTDAGAAVEYNVIMSSQTGDTSPKGIVWPGSGGKLWASHNSIDLIGSGGQGIVCYSSCTSDTTITSNAVAASAKAVYVDTSTPTITGNVFNGAVQASSSGPTNSTAAILWTNPPVDLTEQSGSPTVDHATTTNFASDIAGNPVPDVAGTPSDAGAYELATGGSSSSTTTSSTTTTPPPPPPTAPPTPTGLAVSGQTQTSLTLSWTASQGATSYDTFLNGAAAGTTTTTSQTFGGLTCGTTYTLGVDAANSAGKSSQATMTGTTSACPTGGKIQHVVVIVDENQDFSNVFGSGSAPNWNKYATQFGYAANYYANGHFSLDNYLTMTSGLIGVGNNDSCVSISNDNIFHQLGSGNAVNYVESGNNACRHEPATQYSDLGASFTQTLPSTFTSTTFAPKYVFISPNLSDDGHDTNVATADSYIGSIVPQIMATPQYQAGTMAIFLTWDESNVNDVQGTTSPPNNHVLTDVISPVTPAGTRSTTTLTHCSLLKTVEDLFGVPELGCAGSAAGMTGFGF